MSAETERISDEMLLAYVDGRLDAASAQRVEAWLAATPDRAAEIAAWRRQNEAIGALYPLAANGRAVPARLDPRAIAGRVRGQTRRWMQALAAGLLLVTVGAGLGYGARGWLDGGPSAAAVLIADAVTAHRLYTNEKRHAVEVAASEQDHLVTWLSNRIERKIDAPDLGAEGFSLVGGRLLPPNGTFRAGPAAQLMYEDESGRRLTVYITAGLERAGPAYQLVESDGYTALYWANALVTCTVVGSMPGPALDLVAQQIYRQLDWPAQTQ